MIYKWFDNGNKCFIIRFDKLTFTNIFRIQHSDSKKGINSYIEKHFWIFGFQFTYIDVNYDNIVFVRLSSKNNYTNSKNSHKIQVLKETLISWTKDIDYIKHCPPFNWNFKITDDGEYIFYITGEKKWFINNGLEDLVTGFREITFNDIETYNFPKYNPKITGFFVNLTDLKNK